MEKRLDTKLAPGGKHAAMSTHNQLLNLGPDLYFEVIAVDPDAPAPGRRRWFNLDAFEGPPRLMNWALQTDDIEGALRQLGPEFGPAISLERGDLRWKMAVPDSGILPWGGWGPALIEWNGPLPAPRLPDEGIRLDTLVLHHPAADEIAERLNTRLAPGTIAFRKAVTPALEATFTTPRGDVTLR
ncbi:polyphosphate kinase [Litoreibacter roseus]|uniref:Polyphosphate kinase n=2 Tax=Litoreibacter roseus TaxID=2601869 RepID=A0A6N6JK44_9RHOB|nr:polyphosphate kinase [Litoreibacter roseus]